MTPPGARLDDGMIPVVAPRWGVRRVVVRINCRLPAHRCISVAPEAEEGVWRFVISVAHLAWAG
jgi:hypothetical protein